MANRYCHIHGTDGCQVRTRHCPYQNFEPSTYPPLSPNEKLAWVAILVTLFLLFVAIYWLTALR